MPAPGARQPAAACLLPPGRRQQPTAVGGEDPGLLDPSDHGPTTVADAGLGTPGELEPELLPRLRARFRPPGMLPGPRKIFSIGNLGVGIARRVSHILFRPLEVKYQIRREPLHLLGGPAVGSGDTQRRVWSYCRFRKRGT